MAGRHNNSQSLLSSAERDGATSAAGRDRDRDYDSAREAYYGKEKDRERIHGRDGERRHHHHHHRDRLRNRERDRESDKAGRIRRDEGDANRKVSPSVAERPSIGVESKADPPKVPASASSEDSPNSGKSSLSGHGGKDMEREPGELSSGRSEETSEGAVAGQQSSEGPVASSSKPLHHYQGGGIDVDATKGDSPSSGPTKKRKYSPIVWDLDEKPSQKFSGISTISLSSSKASPSKLRPAVASPPLPPAPVRAAPSSPPLLPSPPPILASRTTPNKHSMSPANATARATPPGHSGRSATPPSSSVAKALPLPIPKAGSAKVPSWASGSSRSFTPSPSSPERPKFPPSKMESDPEQEQQDDDTDIVPAPRINIAASRWAEESTSPSEGKSPHLSGKGRTRRSLSSESNEGRVSSDENGGGQGSENSLSPEPGEYIRDKSENPPGATAGNNLGKDPDIRLDEQYEKELNERELMDIDDEDLQPENEEQHPEEESEEEEQPPAPVAPPLRTINMLQGCRSVDEFEKLNKIDEGTYGVVYRARNKKTGEIVALKKVKMEKEREGFPMTSLREINVLLSIHHPSVVDVKEVVVGSNLDSIYMVMEYMEHDLKGLMETIKQPFSQSEVKCLMVQLFEGVKYLHDNWVLHRDLKTSNLLLNNRGELKICDFGLARQYGSPLKTYTHMVVTLWYRAPELLLGAKQYSTAVDMWSLGCIMAEFLAKEPLFNGKNELDQLDKIFKVLGTPNETIWPDFARLPGVKCNFVRQPFNRLREKFPPTAFAGRPPLSESGFNLLNRLLLYDPKKRITAEEALNHEWFKEVPLPKIKELMPTYPARSEHERRSRRLQKSPDPLAEQRKRELRQAELGAGGLFG